MTCEKHQEKLYIAGAGVQKGRAWDLQHWKACDGIVLHVSFYNCPFYGQPLDTLLSECANRPTNPLTLPSHSQSPQRTMPILLTSAHQ